MHFTIDGLVCPSREAVFESRPQSYKALYWWNKVNSIDLYRGRRSSEAHLIVTKQMKDAIDPAASHTIDIFHDTGTVTTKRWWLYQCESVFNSGDGNHLYYMHFRDPRQIGEMKTVNQNPTNVVNTHRKRVGTQPTAVTWQTVINDLWALLPAEAKAASASAPTLPSSPVSNAENLSFEGISTWRAICQCLEACGFVPLFNPITETYSFVPYDGTQSGLSAAIAANASKLNWSGYTPTLAQLNNAEKVGLVFPSSKSSTIKLIWDSTPAIKETATGTSGILTGTRVDIVDTTRVEYTNLNAVSNQTQIDNRATDLNKTVKGKMRASTSPTINSFGGYVGILPGEEVTLLSISVKGKDQTTDVHYYEPLQFDTPNHDPAIHQIPSTNIRVMTPAGGIPAGTATTPGSATCTLAEAYVDTGVVKIRVKSPAESVFVINDQPSAIAGSSFAQCILVDDYYTITTGPCA